jgi:hypothetical protein
MGRFATAWNAFWSILKSDDAAENWRNIASQEKNEAQQLPPAPQPEKERDRDRAGAVYTLALLQREGRLVDFLQEDISAYADAQVGAAVRQIHENCRNVLQEYFGIEPLKSETEGEKVDVPEGFDPRHIRVVGNAAGKPPFNGTLRHKGWKAAKVNLPERHDALDPTVVCPAEVEV